MQDDQDLRAKLEAAIAQGQKLRDEVQQLKTILAQHSIPYLNRRSASRQAPDTLPRPPKLGRLERLATTPRKLPCSDLYSAGERTYTRSDGARRMERGLIAPRVRKIG
jgi:hypothetical protein